MVCPYCKSRETEVVETRVLDDGESLRRRRTCEICSKRFTTYERIETVTLLVKKKDGKREQFSREKLKGGILKACEKTVVGLAHITTIVNDIEKELMSGDTVEIESKMIGEMVALRLKKIDKVAYIRFSSVFKHFVDIEDFQNELKKLIS